MGGRWPSVCFLADSEGDVGTSGRAPSLLSEALFNRCRVEEKTEARVNFEMADVLRAAADWVRGRHRDRCMSGPRSDI